MCGYCQRIVKEYKTTYPFVDCSLGCSPSSLGIFHTMPSSSFHASSTERIFNFVSVGNEEVKDELDTYMDKKLVPFNVEDNFDFLAWWKVNNDNKRYFGNFNYHCCFASKYAFSMGGPLAHITIDFM